MLNNKLVSALGLCRRAGKLAIGHDAVFDSVRKKIAKAVLLTSDASERHIKELKTVNFTGEIVYLPFDMQQAEFFIGKKSCIFSVNDSGLWQLTDKSIKEAR